MTSPSEERPSSSQPQAPKRSKFWRFFKACFFLGLGFALAGLALLIGLYFYFSKDLPDIRAVEDYQPPQMSRIYAADGTIIGEAFEDEGRRTIVPLDKISKTFQNAVLAAEDADFYHHEGLDYWGMLRAIKDALKKGRFTSGASTITQQTVKNLLLSSEKTLARKLREQILARKLETYLTKNDILTIYLNMIYLGHGRYGVEEAARYYFGKSASDLELPEAALIAGIIQSPENLTPRRHPEAALRRRAYVLEQMEKHHFATPEEIAEAQKAPLNLAPIPQIETPEVGWFVNRVRSEVERRYGREALMRGGLRIHTSLDPVRQKAAVEALQKGLEQLDQRHAYGRPTGHIDDDELEKWHAQRRKKLKDQAPALGQSVIGRFESEKDGHLFFDLAIGRAQVSAESIRRFQQGKKPLELKPGDLMALLIREDGPRHPEVMQAVISNAPQGSLVVIEPKTRKVLAMVGGYSYRDAPFNRASSARRQPGSLFKPFVWGAAFESHRFTPASTLIDAPETWRMYQGQWWTPQNYTKKFTGPISLRKALANSVNSISIKLASDVGIESVQSFARRAGIQSPLTDSLTLALGASEVTPLEITNAYATLASGGQYQPPVFINKIENLPQSLLEDLPEEEPVELPDPLPEDEVWLLREVMRSVVTEGSAQKLKAFPRYLVGKTGTSNDARDAWFVGLLPDVTLSIWLGFDQPKSLGKKESGGGAAVPIALQYLQSAEKEGENWPPMPDGVIQLKIDPESGRRTEQGGVDEYFLTGTEPTEFVLPEGETDAENFLKQEAPTADPAAPFEMFIPKIEPAELPEDLKPVAPVYVEPAPEKDLENQVDAETLPEGTPEEPPKPEEKPEEPPKPEEKPEEPPKPEEKPEGDLQAVPDEGETDEDAP